MSEIKGQLLGIILVLMIFAAVSGVVAIVFNNASQSISNKADHAFDGAASALHYTDPVDNSGSGSGSGEQL